MLQILSGIWLNSFHSFRLGAIKHLYCYWFTSWFRGKLCWCNVCVCRRYVVLPFRFTFNHLTYFIFIIPGNTFAATLGTTFGGIIGSLSIAFLPWAGIQAAYIAPAPSLLAGVVDLYKSLSLVFFVALIPIFIVFLSALKTAFPLAGGAFLICIAVILDGVYFLQFPSQEVIKTTSGAIYIIVGIILFYVATAIMNQEEDIPVVSIKTVQSLSRFHNWFNASSLP